VTRRVAGRSADKAIQKGQIARYVIALSQTHTVEQARWMHALDTRTDRAPVEVSSMSTTYYLISDLHIGGDGGLARCDFEHELIEFLAQIAAGPTPAELIIVGDAFGFWELTDREGPSKPRADRRHVPRAFPPAPGDRRAPPGDLRQSSVTTAPRRRLVLPSRSSPW